MVAIQQIASIERDLVPRLVDAINQGDGRYEYVIGEPTGPADRPEQLAFIFDTATLHVDRRQTYTVEDPENHVTFDPLVAWFRAAQPPASQAWTFSLVNIRVDLARAPTEVALLPGMLTAIRNDGRGEDDIVVAGLFQADDAYLLPTVDGEKVRAAVRSRPTDIFGKYQTSNVLVESASHQRISRTRWCLRLFAAIQLDAAGSRDRDEPFAGVCGVHGDRRRQILAGRLFLAAVADAFRSVARVRKFSGNIPSATVRADATGRYIRAIRQLRGRPSTLLTSASVP